MDSETVRQIAAEAVQPVSERMDKFIESEKESRRVMGNLLDRLTTVVAGDKDFSQPGLVQTVADHSRQLQEFSTIKSEVKTTVRTLLLIGGGLITIINLGIRLYEFSAHK